MARRNKASQQCARIRIIKQRGNACEKCGYPGYVELHHIIQAIDGGKFDNNNLLLLCEKCHADAHGNIKRKYMDKYRLGWESR
ncbi:MAG: hypothetical protein UW18_C0018G0007 [Microgenomates group bacterium GW2011_GWF1_44_10]|nr:MAG: hypothetical protein UW18_C0018G0007 [Microgenomates group bacterium GW2011_GWF1_44_10]